LAVIPHGKMLFWHRLGMRLRASLAQVGLKRAKKHPWVSVAQPLVAVFQPANARRHREAG